MTVLPRPEGSYFGPKAKLGQVLYGNHCGGKVIPGKHQLGDGEGGKGDDEECVVAQEMFFIGN